MKASKFLYFPLILIILVSSSLFSASAEDNIKVMLNGTELSFDVPPQLVNSRTMVPMRKIFEALGAVVEWNSDTETVTAVKDETVIIMQIDNVAMQIDEKNITLDVPPMLIDNRTLVPIRAVAEGLNADVLWDNDTRTVVITKEETAEKTRPAKYPEEGILFGYGDDGIAELQYNARCAFEQNQLPLTFFVSENETIDYINNSNVDKIKEDILEIWKMSAKNAILNDLELSGKSIRFDNEEYMDEKLIEYDLGDEHIDSVTLEKIDADTNAIIIKLIDTSWMSLSTYIGITYNKDLGLKYFTLEKSLDSLDDGSENYMFCSVEFNSRSSYYSVKNNKIAFINAIKDMCVPLELVAGTAVAEEGALIDGRKCTLIATVTVIDFESGGAVSFDEDTSVSTLAGVSIYNDKGENITSKLYFRKIQLSKGSEIVNGIIYKKSNSSDHSYDFASGWKPGDFVDVTVEIEDSKGKLVKIGAKNIKVWDLEESLQNLLGLGMKVEIN